MVKGIPIKELHRLISRQPIIVKTDTTISDLAKMIVVNPHTHSFYVIDGEEKLVGKITVKRLVEHLFGEVILEEEFDTFLAVRLTGAKKVRDIMAKPIYVTPEVTLKEAFMKMRRNNLEEMPVVDENMFVIGDLNMIELIAALVEKQEKSRGEKYLKVGMEVPFFNITGRN